MECALSTGHATGNRAILIAIDAIRAYLAQTKELSETIEGGLDYLVASWDRFATELEIGDEVWVWEEWVHDLDTRETIEGLFDNVPESHRARVEVEAVDMRFRRVALVTEDCSWGERNALDYGWTREKNWWYWTAPPRGYFDPIVG